uniref:Chromosome segregation ATPase family protein n=1 Tax=Coccidioides posadasii RMSCC 3488 TaxID=454284 RepID=A0A0J6FTY0_COCPO|nr:hypothetical protein CPAG_09132 [Coccidioides posadasii RMSCC 3488]
MASNEREGYSDRELVLKGHHHRHHHSISETGRPHIPMWDSADPDRAPPPLPLNPGSGSPKTRANASATIQAAAAALVEKSYDNTPSAYTVNPMPLKPSPEKSLIKGQYHKRMQSFQNATTNSREFASYLERRSPEKAHRASVYEPENRTPEKKQTRSSNSTPSGRESPTHRPSSRYLSKPILGENTPPSATMLALQNMQVPIDIDLPQSALTTSANTPSKQQPQSIEALSAQIISLTSIATSLQQEMAQLSRRSKDNATDLVSLKAATNARDEDIRKSLKELASNLSSKIFEAENNSRSSVHPNTSSYMIDNRDSSPSSRKSYSLPRMPSPSSFAAAMERELTGSPAISTDGSASIALLEKVLREMATKEGQEQLLQLVEGMKSNSGDKNTDGPMLKMLEEILNVVKESSNSRALVKSRALGDNTGIDASMEGSDQLANVVDRDGSPMPSNAITEDVLSILKRVKASVSEGGGITNEVKALVRELRGEVLGMGREIARKLEEAEARRGSDENKPIPPSQEEIQQIVEGGLVELRQQMERLIHESQSQAAPPPVRCNLDSEEIYLTLQKALEESPLANQPPPQPAKPGIEREEILEAVREAWETYKPEIELQNFGLEREEILECLAEGLKEYQPKKDDIEPGATYEQVVDAITQGLQSFNPPRVEPDVSSIRDDLVNAVRECLESFEWPIPPAVFEREALSRDDVLSAVREGFENHEPAPKEPEIKSEEVFEAVRAGFQDASNSLSDTFGGQVMDHFHEVVAEIKDEFKEYSAANGRDTEQVLDAIKGGLEVLRGEVESYVDRAADVTGKDEIIDTVKEGFRLLQADIEKTISESSQNRPTDTVELLDAMEKEFEHLRQTLSNLLIRSNISSEKDEILDAIRDITENDQFKKNNSEVSDMIKEEFTQLRETLSMAIVKSNPTTEKDEIISAFKESFEILLDEYNRKKDSESVLSNTSELLDAFHDGVDVLRSDMDKILNKAPDMSVNDELLNILRDGLASVKTEIEQLRDFQKEADETNVARGKELMLASESSIGADIESLKVLVTQLQIKVESIEPVPEIPEIDPNITKKEDLVEMVDAIKEIQSLVSELSSRENPLEGAAMKEDVEAVGLLVDSIKARLDELSTSTNASFVTAERVEGLEVLTKELKDLITGFVAHVETEGPTKNEVANLETVLKDVWAAVEDLKAAASKDLEEDPEKIVKEDFRNVETLIFEIKSQLDEFVLPDVQMMPTKDDLGLLTTLVNEFKEKMEVETELTAQAFEARKIEHGGLAEKIEDAKALISGLRDEIKEKLSESDESLNDLKTMVLSFNDAAENLAKAETIKELSDLVNREFERSHGDREAAKMETEEKHSELLSRQEEGRDAILSDLGARIDEKFNEVIAKYEDAQSALESKFVAVEERDVQSFETLTSTRSLAEDIKMVIGGMGDTLSEACDRMSDDAKTFFERVDQSFLKVDEMHTDVKMQHEDLKGQFEKAVAATDRLERHLADSHPEILNSVKDILAIVGQHYEHSRRMTEELKTDLSAIPQAIPPLFHQLALPAPEEPKEELEKYDDSKVHEKLDTLLSKELPEYEKYDDSQLHEKLDALLLKEVPEPEKYDDSQLQEKLDALLLKEIPVPEKYDDSQVQEKLDALLLKEVPEPEKYDDSQLQEKLDALLLKEVPVPEKYDDSQVQEKLDTLLLKEAPEPEKYDDSQVLEKLDAILLKEAPEPEKYDDSQVHEKLDTILKETSATTESMARIDKLDEIHEQLTSMAREVSELMATQTKIVTEERSNKEKEAMETAIALEKRLAQKEKVEAEIVSLNEEKQSLLESVRSLKEENDDLSKYQVKLAKEVAGLETALRIRREEVQLMESRAEDLERRIVEGVLDHARSQLLGRPSSMDGTNLKRVPSSASTATRKSVASNVKDGVLSSGVNLALKRRKANAASTLSSNSGNGRRILSLSHVTGNRGTKDRQLLPQSNSGGLANLKRSHSVKSTFPFRKASWDTRSSIANKENEVVKEEDETCAGDVSDAETERRTSYGDSLSYVAGSTVSTDRRTSCSSTNALVSAEHGTLVEGSVDNDSHTEEETVGGEDGEERSPIPSEFGDEHDIDGGSDLDRGDLVVYNQPSDSGIGADMPSSASEKGFNFAQESVLT